MGYGRKFWQDHVTEFQNRFKETSNSDGSITHTPADGSVLQQGTPQNAVNFNNLEEGIFASNEMGCESALKLLHHEQALKQLDGVTGEVSLTNTLDYPFNNALATVALTLAAARKTTNYSVDIEVLSSSGGDIGHIQITDKLKNGFKVAYSGSAKTAKFKYIVKGGVY